VRDLVEALSLSMAGSVISLALAAMLLMMFD
jgi:hypothetical protein